MSTTIDQRVVQMRFDNGQFEAGVANTMSSISKLKQSLDFDRTAQTVGLKFNAMYSFADQWMRNMANTVESYAKRIVSALTIDPVMSGFSEYETKINAIQTIMSNTASKGTTMDDITRVIGELNTYADKTIYNFAEMTRNIGTFTAAGVGLEDSAAAIQGIANLAAASGSTSQQASTAMYQLSQALAAGTVKLMDWNSVVNAGMGGEKFQEALKATARDHGIAVDDIIKKQGSFRESLSEGWITADILNETLNKFTVKGATEYANAMLESGKYTQEQADALIKEARAMEDAATKVKTFTQLWDTLKESAQSGWSQTWEIIIGDFEEAKDFLTTVSDTIGGIIGRSADARNEILENWKVLGGRTELINGITNAFKAIQNIIAPISEGFREIFPQVTAEKLVYICEQFNKYMIYLRDRFEEGSERADKLKRTFKGLFAIVDIGVQLIVAIAKGIGSLIKVLLPAGDGILSLGAGLGDSLVALRDWIEETDLFNNVIGKVVGVLAKAIKAFGKFLSFIIGGSKNLGEIALLGIQSFVERVQLRFESLRNFGLKLKDIFSSIGNFFKFLWNLISPLVKGVVGLIKSMGKAIKDAFSKDANFNGVYDILNVGLIGAMTIGVSKIIKLLSRLEETGISGLLKNFFGNSIQPIIEGVTKIIDGVTGCFKAFQSTLKAEVLMKIAKAIGLLTISLVVLSLIDSDALMRGLGAISGLFTILFLMLKSFEGLKYVKDKNAFGGIQGMCASLIGIAASILLLTFAVAKLGSMDTKTTIQGLLGVVILLFGVGLSMQYFAVGIDKSTGKAEKAIIKGVRRLIIITSAIAALAAVVYTLGSMNFKDMMTGLLGLLGVTAILLAVIHMMPKSGSISGAYSMVIVSASLFVLGAALKFISTIPADKAGSAIRVVGGALVVLGIGLHAMKGTLFGSASLLVASVALVALAGALKVLGMIPLVQIIKAVVAIGASLLVLAVGLTAMIAALPGAAALLVASVSLMAFAGVLATIGAMKFSTILKSLASIALIFATLGIASLILAPVIPILLLLSGAIALMGVALLAAGAGVSLFATGMLALSAAFAGGAHLIVEGIKAIVLGIIGLVPAIVSAIGAAIITFCDVIINSSSKIAETLISLINVLCDVLIKCVPKIAETVLKLIVTLLDMLVDYAPKLSSGLVNLLIGLINGVASRMPDLIAAVVNLFMSIFQGAIDAMKGMDSKVLLEGILSIGLFMGLLYLLGTCASLLPAAMLGVLGLGLIVAELALVFAAIGKLAKIPGLKDAIADGGAIFAAVGKAIGKFIGSIMGGIIEGVTSSFPQIGTDLSNFMKNVQPFITGAAAIKPETLDGVTRLVGIILALTAADLIDSLTSWFTGGSSLADFGKELVPFGIAMAAFSAIVTNIDNDSVEAAASAGKMLAEMAATIPNSGGLWSFFAGENDMNKFSGQLILFGAAMVGFSKIVSGNVDAAAVEAAASAGSMLTEMASTIPNTGGLVAFFTGDNDLVRFGAQLIPFGVAIAGFCKAVSGKVNPDAVEAAVNAGTMLVDMAGKLPNTGGLVSWFTGDNDIAKFGSKLVLFGVAMAAYSLAVSGINAAAVTASAIAGQALAEMAATLPKSGGLWSFFAGDKDMSEFGKQLVKFGAGIAAYSWEIAGVNVAKLSAVTTEFGRLVEVARGASGVDFGAFSKSLKEVSGKCVDSFVETFANAHSRVHNAVVDLLTVMGNAFKAKSVVVSNAAIAVAKTAAISVRVARPNFFSAGNDLANGLAAGIRNGQSGVLTSAVNMALSAANKVREVLKINSPSKVLTDIGHGVPEGFSAGIDEFGGMVATSVAHMGDGAIVGVQDSVAKIADAINSDIDAEPTIRPILDLSAVRSGASAIGGLFGSGASIGVSANVGAISSAMSRRGQNGGVNDVISSLDKLRKDINGMERNSYNIGGVYYEEGSDVAEAFKVIVREAKIERRR